MRVLVIILIVAAEWAAAADASAQARATVVPSISLSTVYDDNLFARARGDAGQMTQLRPSLEADYESPKVILVSLWSFDMQRSNHSALNTLDARRHGMFDAHFRATPTTTFAVGAHYDRTETPGEINFESGILTDRRSTDRWQITPSIAHRIDPRTTITAQYDWTSEALVNNGEGALHVARAGLSRQWSPRTTFTVSYLGRLFVDDIDTNRSDAALVGWTQALAPGTSLTLQAGPRLTSYRGLKPEIVAAFARNTTVVKLALDYWHGETIVLGIHGPVEVDSTAGRLTWPITRTVEIGTHLGMSDIATLDKREATVYRASAVAAWSPGGMFTVAASYGADFQHGDLRRSLFADERIFRHVFRVTMTVAPRLSRSFLPADEAARAKGVSR